MRSHCLAVDNEERKMTSREEFERDAEPYGYNLMRAGCGCCDYYSDSTENRWKGWQASREAIKAGAIEVTGRDIG